GHGADITRFWPPVARGARAAQLPNPRAHGVLACCPSRRRRAVGHAWRRDPRVATRPPRRFPSRAPPRREFAPLGPAAGDYSRRRERSADLGPADGLP